MGVIPGVQLGQQPVQVKPPCEHRHSPIWRPGPRFLRTVPVQLDAVVVRVTQIQGFADSVVAGTVQLDPCVDQTTQGVRKRPPGWVEDGDVVEPRGARRRGDPPRLSQVFSPMWWW